MDSGRPSKEPEKLASTSLSAATHTLRGLVAGGRG